MDLSDSEILQKAVADGIIDINTLGKQIEMNERKKYLDMHKNKIWQSEKDHKWRTYLPNEEKGRELVKYRYPYCSRPAFSIPRQGLR